MKKEKFIPTEEQIDFLILEFPLSIKTTGLSQLSERMQSEPDYNFYDLHHGAGTNVRNVMRQSDLFDHNPHWLDNNWSVLFRAAIEKVLSPKEILKSELKEVVDRIFDKTDSIKAESAMYLLRNSEVHNPDVFKEVFSKFKADVELMQKVVKFYESGKIPD